MPPPLTTILLCLFGLAQELEGWWEVLSSFFRIPPEIRKIVYSNDIIRGPAWTVRKVTKAKSVFHQMHQQVKMLYLASMNHDEEMDRKDPELGPGFKPVDNNVRRSGGKVPVTQVPPSWSWYCYFLLRKRKYPKKTVLIAGRARPHKIFLR